MGSKQIVEETGRKREGFAVQGIDFQSFVAQKIYETVFSRCLHYKPH